MTLSANFVPLRNMTKIVSQITLVIIKKILWGDPGQTSIQIIKIFIHYSLTFLCSYMFNVLTTSLYPPVRMALYGIIAPIFSGHGFVFKCINSSTFFLQLAVSPCEDPSLSMAPQTLRQLTAHRRSGVLLVEATLLVHPSFLSVYLLLCFILYVQEYHTNLG